MNLKTISTGSSGNCYLLQHGTDQLMLDVGIPMDKILKALDFKLSYLDGVLLTHQHL